MRGPGPWCNRSVAHQGGFVATTDRLIELFVVERTPAAPPHLHVRGDSRGQAGQLVGGLVSAAGTLGELPGRTAETFMVFSDNRPNFGLVAPTGRY